MKYNNYHVSLCQIQHLDGSSTLSKYMSSALFDGFLWYQDGFLDLARFFQGLPPHPAMVIEIRYQISANKISKICLLFGTQVPMSYLIRKGIIMNYIQYVTTKESFDDIKLIRQPYNSHITSWCFRICINNSHPGTGRLVEAHQKRVLHLRVNAHSLGASHAISITSWVPMFVGWILGPSGNLT